jgi:septum formation inhibitor MinC
VLKFSQIKLIAEAAAKCGRTDLVERMKQMHNAKVLYNREYVLDVMFRIKADRLIRQLELGDLRAWLADEHAIRRAELQALREEVEELKAEARQQRAEARSQVADHAARRREAYDVWQQYQMVIKRLRSGQEEAPGSHIRVAGEQD